MLDYGRLVGFALRRAPGGVRVSSASGDCVGGVLDHEDLEQGDSQGFTRLVGSRVVTVPAACLSSVAVEDTIVVTDRANVATSYSVRDIRLAEDGLVKRFVVVPL